MSEADFLRIKHKVACLQQGGIKTTGNAKNKKKKNVFQEFKMQIKITTIKIDYMESNKRTYTMPTIKVYPIQEDYLLQKVSGQHEHIGQGGTFGSAKHWTEEWDENQTSPTTSEEGENTQPNYGMLEE